MLHRGSLLLLAFALGCEGHFIEPDLPGTGEPPITNAAFAIRLGGSGSELVTGAVTDAAGNVFLAGTFTESADFDPGSGIIALTSLGGSDGFLAKYSAAGALLWVSQLSGTGGETVAALGRDAAGNLYVGGSFTGSTDFDPGAGFQVLNSVGGEDGFVAKYGAAGELIWARRFGGTASDAVEALAVDAAGVSYAAGEFSGQAHALPQAGTPIVGDGDQPDGFVLSLDAAGSVRWSLPLGGPLADAANTIALSGTGSVVVAGSFRGSADFARNATPVPLTAQGGADVFLASYSSAGLLQWARDIGGLGEESSPSGGLSVTPQNEIALLGSFSGNADFDAGAGVVAKTSISPADLFLVRYDAAGTFASVLTVGGQGTVIGTRALADADGSILVTGSFTGAMNFDPGAATSLASLAQAGASDVFVARYSPAGGLLWVSRFGEATSVSERANSGTALALDPDLSVMVAGLFFGSPDFDPGNTSFRLTSVGGADAFLVRLTAAGALATVP